MADAKNTFSQLGISPFYSLDDWKALGRMGRGNSTEETYDPRQKGVGQEKAGRRRGLIDAGREAKAEEDLGGSNSYSDSFENESSQGSGVRDYTGQRERHAFTFLGRPEQMLGGIKSDFLYDDAAAGSAQWAHFMRILTQEGPQGERLVMAAARLNKDMADAAKEHSHGKRDFSVIAPKRDSARVIRALLDAVDETCTIPLARTRNNMRSSDEESAEDTMKRYKNAGKDPREAARKKMKIPYEALINSFKEKAAMNLLASFELEDANGKPKTFKGKIAVIADPGQARQAAEWIMNSGSKDYVYSVDPRVLSVIGKMKGAKPRIEADFDSGASQPKQNQQIIANSQATVVFTPMKSSGYTYRAAGYAAARGQLMRVVDPNGKTVPTAEAGRFFMKGFISPAEAKHAKLLDALKMSVSTPQARYLLDLMADPYGKGGKKDIEDNDIMRMAQSSKPLGAILGAARTEEGKQSLRDQMRLSGRVISLLANEKAVARAERTMTDNMQPASNKGIDLVGSEAMPDALKGLHPYFFTQGDMRNVKPDARFVAMIGDPIKSSATNLEGESVAMAVSSGLAPLVSGLRKEGASLLFMENSLPLDVKPEAGDIVILSSGHLAPRDENTMKARDNMVKAGVVLVATQNPVGTVRWDREKKQEYVIASDETNPSRREAAKIVGAAASTLVVTNIDAKYPKSLARVAIEASFEAQKANGAPALNRPVLLDMPSMPGADGNRQMNERRGENALKGAGFPDPFVLKYGPEFEGVKPAISAGAHPERAATAIVQMAEGNAPEALKNQTRKRNQEEATL